MLMWQSINNRGHHSHYLSGKLSSCTSPVSGNKLMWCRNYTGTAVTQTISPTAADSNTRVCWVYHVLAQSSQKQQDDFIMCYLFSSCFFLFLLPGTLHSFFLPSSPMFWSWWQGGRTTVSLRVDLDKGGFVLFFPVNVIVLWSEWSIQSGVFINHHYCVAHVGRWCNGLTRPLSQQYQQICPPSCQSVPPGIQKMITAMCFAFYCTFIFNQRSLFSFQTGWRSFIPSPPAHFPN